MCGATQWRCSPSVCDGFRALDCVCTLAQALSPPPPPDAPVRHVSAPSADGAGGCGCRGAVRVRVPGHRGGGAPGPHPPGLLDQRQGRQATTVRAGLRHRSGTRVHPTPAVHPLRRGRRLHTLRARARGGGDGRVWVCGRRGALLPLCRPKRHGRPLRQMLLRVTHCVMWQSRGGGEGGCACFHNGAARGVGAADERTEFCGTIGCREGGGGGGVDATLVQQRSQCTARSQRLKHLCSVHAARKRTAMHAADRGNVLAYGHPGS
jgi:hypothetical protein